MTSKSRNGSIVSLDDPFDCSKLVDLNIRELDDLIKEYEMGMERVRGEIVKVYEKAQPYLLQIRELKKRYKALGLKFEATRAFAMVEKGGSLVSSIDMKSLREASGMLEPNSPDIEEDPKTPERGATKKKGVGKPSAAAVAAANAAALAAAKKKGPYSGIQSKVVLNWIDKSKESRGGGKH
jgi:hypothetical protein